MKKTIDQYLSDHRPAAIRTTVRLRMGIHDRVRSCAERLTVSFNQFVCAALEKACDEADSRKKAKSD